MHLRTLFERGGGGPADRVWYFVLEGADRLVATTETSLSCATSTVVEPGSESDTWGGLETWTGSETWRSGAGSNTAAGCETWSGSVTSGRGSGSVG